MNGEIMQEDWELSNSFASLDDRGVRAACILDGLTDADAYRIVAGTQGGALFAFSVPSGDLSPVPYQHNHSITALVASEDRTFFVTGCKDALIRVFDSKDFTLRFTLDGHEKPVTSLSWCRDSNGKNFLLSGSWDGTAKVWDVDNVRLLATLTGHENSVCCTGLPPKDPSTLLIATGSAGVAQNNTIQEHSVRIWSVNCENGEVTLRNRVANDHEGPIRGIHSLPNAHLLATCSNDGTVKLRSLESGVAASTLLFVNENPQNQPPMLLSLALIDSALLVACAEDGHVVIWSLEDAGQPQQILHPSCVWSITNLPSGDFATCCDDGQLRIFTRMTDRMAPEAVRKHFADEVAVSRQRATGGPSPEEIAKLPRWENNLQNRGRSEGQVQVFQKEGLAIAAQWSESSQTWIEVGQVTGSQNNDTGVIDGVQYDFVFPIEVDQTGGGVAKLQIGYNTGENPFTAAQRFIDGHMLPQHHLAQIADYIQKRAGAAAPTLGGDTASVATPMPATGVPLSIFQHLPIKLYRTFDLSEKTATATMEKMKTKIEETGQVDEDDLAQIGSLMEVLISTSRYHSSTIPKGSLHAILRMMLNLKPSEAFPALDLARMAALHPDASASAREQDWTAILDAALSMDASPDALEGAAAVAVPMLTIRLFANCFKGGSGSQAAVLKKLEAAVSIAMRHVSSTNKNIRLSVATLVHNIAFHIYGSGATGATVASELLPIASSILSSPGSYEAEATMRTIQAVGTIALSSTEAKKSVNMMHFVSKVEPAASPHSAVVKEAAREVYAALQ